MRLTPILFGVFLFGLMLACAPAAEAGHHGGGEGRRIGAVAKKLLHPLRTLKARRHG